MWGFFEGQPLTIIGRTTVQVYPRFLYSGPVDPRVAGSRHVLHFESVVDAFHAVGAYRLGLVRTYALGDILMLLPVVRALHRQLGELPVRIYVKPEYWRVLAPWRTAQFEFWRWDGGRVHETAGTLCDVNLDLNGCLESDHWGGEDSRRHRLDLYARAMGLELRAR